MLGESRLISRGRDSGVLRDTRASTRKHDAVPAGAKTFVACWDIVTRVLQVHLRGGYHICVRRLACYSPFALRTCIANTRCRVARPLQSSRQRAGASINEAGSRIALAASSSALQRPLGLVLVIHLPDLYWLFQPDGLWRNTRTGLSCSLTSYAS